MHPIIGRYFISTPPKRLRGPLVPAKPDPQRAATTPPKIAESTVDQGGNTDLVVVKRVIVDFTTLRKNYSTTLYLK